MELPKKFAPNRHLLQTDDLLKYIMEMTVYPREPPILKQLRDATAKDPLSPMASDPHASQLMGLLLKILNPQKTIEIGVYTGYSLLLTAISTSTKAKITAIDMERESYEIGLPFIREAGVEGKIDFVQSQALPVLDKLLLQEEEGSYDFAFVDADKDNYFNYHDRLMKLVKVGGLVVYDNTLWGGTVAMSDDDDIPRQKREGKVFVDEFNRRIAADDCVEICLVPVGDGLTICRRIS
ncbi:Probable caffeoyl-CoA O-methyltransferase At4g26220 [Linum grandiflorum]